MKSTEAGLLAFGLCRTTAMRLTPEPLNEIVELRNAPCLQAKSDDCNIVAPLNCTPGRNLRQMVVHSRRRQISALTFVEYIL